jgi:hypothetical protein
MRLSLISKPYFLRLFSVKSEDGAFLCSRINTGYAHHTSTYFLFFYLVHQTNLIDFKLHHVPP